MRTDPTILDVVVTPFAVTLGVLIPAALGGWIGASKGQGFVGVLLGAFLSYLGVILVMVMKPAAGKHASDQSGPAGWWPDPHQRHQLRYFDGHRWTHHVSDNGVTTVEA